MIGSLARTRIQWALYARHLAASRRPILVGPWTSEVGFEALYWLPFLAQFRQRYGIDKRRIVAIGRGGSGAWYDAAAVGDVYEHASVQDVRLQAFGRAKATGSIKQAGVTAWDRHVCGLVASSLGIPRYQLLHPSWMYQLLAPYWLDVKTLRYLQHYTKHVRLGPPALPPDLRLPPKFVAVRFYIRSTFPASEELMLWAQTITQRLASRYPVVLLQSGGHYDDHADVIRPDGSRILGLPPLPPAQNLAILSAILGRATAFVGTYGGFAQLALMLGIPSVSCYAEWGGTALAHLSLSHVLGVAGGVPFHVIRPHEPDLWAHLVTRPDALPLSAPTAG